MLLKLSLTGLDMAGAWHRESGYLIFVDCLNKIIDRQVGSCVLLPSPVLSPTTPYLPFPTLPCIVCWRKQKWRSSPVVGTLSSTKKNDQMSCVRILRVKRAVGKPFEEGILLDPLGWIVFGWAAGKEVDIIGNGSDLVVWNWNKWSVFGGHEETCCMDREFLLLSGERLNGKNRLDYGELWING